MTESKPPQRGVLDDAWEQELVMGQEAAGEAGDLEADLAMLHLLRHARDPEPLGEDALGDVLAQVRAAGAQAAAPWWRHSLIRWVAVPACAGLAVVLIVRPGEGDRATVAAVAIDERGGDALSDRQEAFAEATVPARRGSSPAKPYETQFAALEGSARESLRDAVFASRSLARHDWLASLGAEKQLHEERDASAGSRGVR